MNEFMATGTGGRGYYRHPRRRDIGRELPFLRGGRGNSPFMGNFSSDVYRGSKNPSTERWVKLMADAINRKNGESLSRLLKLQDTSFAAMELRDMPERVMNGIIVSQMGYLDEKWGSSISFKPLLFEFLILRKMAAQEIPKWNEIVPQGNKVLSLILDLYIAPELRPHFWLVPALATLCNFLNRAGFLADQQEGMMEFAEEEEGVGDDETQNKYTKDVLNSIRSKLGKVRGDEELHGAYIVLMGQSIKGCMQLGNMQMAAQFLKAIESQRINLSRVPRGPMVNFRFYLGKLYMQQEAFKKAETELVWAFSHCTPTKMKMRRNILECLVAVRLRLGKLPPLPLLLKYQMHHFIDIVSAMKAGNVSKFDYVMEAFAQELIHHGTILCIERVKFIVYRTLMKRIKYWWKTCGLCAKEHIVPINAFTAALAWQSDDLFDEDEMACISANLISMGYIKGYISWEKMVIVFSQKDPFPNLAATTASTL
ncbi:PCI domain-containing protein [Cardiosporidium cionae]|uniref:PCI domain-containing protein n=1 Tax=Cardiosporidium cionae TaxID=476202 RepID=A0ABQ7JAL4_9APIC|nr:PCI domain-containing protein [Cardiosporidium cionae]|eukprot:KAF8821042.1 PCI domain-containing protein [Cardiosporidium cionae]